MKDADSIQLASFDVEGLFGRYHHCIKFPIVKTEEPIPSVVILHGPNGVGKTTVLRMIDGILRLDFNVFREVPFKRSALTFTTGACIQVIFNEENKRRHLDVTFEDAKVSLNLARPGPLDEKDSALVEAFRQKFFKAREALVFELIDTSRSIRQRPQEEEDTPSRMLEEFVKRERQLGNPKAMAPVERTSLSDRVAKFINEAQVNHRRFFATTEPDLFSRILQKFTEDQPTKYEINPLLERLKTVTDQDDRYKKLGIEVDNWNIAEITKLVDHALRGASGEKAVAALSAFVEVLESRSVERSLLANRLETFLRVARGFFTDKELNVSSKTGLIIETKPPERRILKEQQLSSGEFHLLYLLVAALVTQRRGTVIAIDEPEMSMHLAWQRKLITALFECASKAGPQFILATHSPDIAADFPEALIEVGKG
jgi:energy-coupling factor transporter ATP-binding protein EcfA2